jgi:dienelactone hydrolase
VFAHGSGSSRHSPRNRYVAEVLHRLGFATLLADLLTADEDTIDERTAEFRFDIGLLAQRLGAATEWARSDPNTAALPVGYFGASTGAGAALLAAARNPDRISAVVSRGGRPDLAGPALARVRIPTLLIVGGQDPVVLELNQHAAAQLQCAHELVVVPRATHLFEEPGTLDQAAELAGDWFAQHLRISVASPVGGSSP